MESVNIFRSRSEKILYIFILLCISSPVTQKWWMMNFTKTVNNKYLLEKKMVKKIVSMITRFRVITLQTQPLFWNRVSYHTYDKTVWICHNRQNRVGFAKGVPRRKKLNALLFCKICCPKPVLFSQILHWILSNHYQPPTSIRHYFT